MIHAGTLRSCLPALELQVEGLGRSRSATKAVSRSSCRMSIEVQASRRNQGNGVNYSANRHTIRRTEKNQGNQGCILGNASCPFALISVSQAADADCSRTNLSAFRPVRESSEVYPPQTGRVSDNVPATDTTRQLARQGNRMTVWSKSQWVEERLRRNGKNSHEVSLAGND